MPLMYN